MVIAKVVVLEADPPAPLVKELEGPEEPEEPEDVVGLAPVGTLAGDEPGCDEDPMGWTLEPGDATELDTPAPGPVAVPVGVGGRSPLETEDREDSVAGPELAGPEVPEPEVPGTTVLEAEVTVTGQTVVETGTIIVVTGQSLMLGPQL